MQEQMQSRLNALRKEFEIGQAELLKIENQRTYLREMMLRIGGAIQVLEELLAEGRSAAQDGICLDEAHSAAARTDETNVSQVQAQIT